MKKIRKIMAMALSAAMIMSLTPASQPEAAKGKIKLNKSSVNVKVGNTVKVKLKNGNKKAGVTWKIKSKKIAKITKKSTKGNTAYAIISGKAPGKTTLTATYKLKKKTQKKTCSITVSAEKPASTQAPVTTSQIPAQASATPAANGTEVPKPTATAAAATTSATTTEPSKKPSPTRKPTPTPVPSPDALIYMIKDIITIDGVMDDIWNFAEELTFNNWKADSGQTAQTSDAKAGMLWTEEYLYIYVSANDPGIDTSNSDTSRQDSVDIFFDEHDKKEEYGKNNSFQYRQVIDPSKEGSMTDTGKWDGKAVQSAVKITDKGYVCEFAIPFKEKPANKSFIGLDIQINDAKDGKLNGIHTLFANPSAGDKTPAESTVVFGDALLLIKTEKEEKTVNLNTEDSIELVIPAQFRKTTNDNYTVNPEGIVTIDGNNYQPDNKGNVTIDGNTIAVYAVDEKGAYIPKDDYSEMNTKARFDAEKGIVYCETANNVIFYIPDQFKVEKGDYVDVEIKGTYETDKTTDENGNVTETDNGFRIWLVDTVGKPDPDNPDKKLSSDSAATTSEQIAFTKANGLTLNENNEFTITQSLESREDDKGKSDGTSTALMIKAGSWNGMIGKLTITSIKITVNKPIWNNVPKA